MKPITTEKAYLIQLKDKAYWEATERRKNRLKYYKRLLKSPDGVPTDDTMENVLIESGWQMVTPRIRIKKISATWVKREIKK